MYSLIHSNDFMYSIILFLWMHLKSCASFQRCVIFNLAIRKFKMDQNLKFYYMCRRLTNEDPALILKELDELFETELIPAEYQLKNVWEKEFMSCGTHSLLSYPISYEKKVHKNINLVFNSQGFRRNIELYVLCRNQLQINVNRILAETRKIFGAEGEFNFIFNFHVFKIYIFEHLIEPQK